MVQERVVTRVTKADGSTVNVRNDELAAFLAANAGSAAVTKPDEVVVEVVEDSPPAETRARTPRA